MLLIRVFAVFDAVRVHVVAAVVTVVSFVSVVSAEDDVVALAAVVVAAVVVVFSAAASAVVDVLVVLFAAVSVVVAAAVGCSAFADWSATVVPAMARTTALRLRTARRQEGTLRPPPGVEVFCMAA
ncbi:hypothetical protein Kisp02_04140 [Kineosporia sp. NBRC 101731]|nr:hypothetical protein Kisp02_04140 [Kineosporia sp. NBRC 101731]